MANPKFTKFKIPPIVMLPHGPDAEKLFDAQKRDSKKFKDVSGFDVLTYASETKQMKGSNFYTQAQINRLVVDSGLRVAVPGDDVNGAISNLVGGNYFIDYNAGVVQEQKGSNEKLWRQAIALAEQQGNVEYPFMFQRFYFNPSEGGLEIATSPNFKIISDDRLSAKYNGWKFTHVDENGLPVDLNKSKGDRTWYTRSDGKGLSRVYLYRNSSLVSNYDYLASSLGDGRVVLVSAEGSHENFLEEKLKDLQSERTSQFREIKERYQQAEAILKGDKN